MSICFLALKIFLNADTQLSRLLLTKFLSTLWSIQTWARTQTSFRLYSSSLLLAYDAKRLKSQIFCHRNNSNSSTLSSRSSSADSTSKHTPTLNSDTECQLPTSNAVDETNNTNGCCNGDDHPFNTTDSIQHYKKIQRCHSTQNNYEEVRFHISSKKFHSIWIAQIN